MIVHNIFQKDNTPLRKEKLQINEKQGICVYKRKMSVLTLDSIESHFDISQKVKASFHDF